MLEKKLKHPCVRNCCLDQNDICVGCFRHVNEIMQWQDADLEQQHEILKRADIRRKQKQQFYFANR